MIQGIFDSHSHYDDDAFDSDREELLGSLPSKGVTGVISAGSDLTTSQTCLELASRYPFVFAAVGVHPHEVAEAPANYLHLVKQLTKRPKAVAIGEIGLDYHYDFSPRPLQQERFAQQLELAKELNLPVIVHDREAHADTLELLKKYRPKGVVHCFSGSVELMRETVKLGMYIGLGGAVTFKNARHPVDVAREVPIERLLLETDCPYMAPVPYRGKRCDSSMIAVTATRIAEIRQCDVQDLVNVACQNTLQLFNIPKEALTA
nr:TatD family hydrolase [uncultured Solibaculum sp.]